MRASFNSLPRKFSSKSGQVVDLELRRATLADVPQLVVLCAEHAAFEQAAYVENGQAERLAVYLFGARPAAHCLVVARQQQLMGFATYMPEFSTWEAAYYLHLDCLFLRPEIRSHGVGRSLITAVATEAQRLNCSLMKWQTPEFNANAIAFYRRLGATEKPKRRFFLDLAQYLAAEGSSTISG